MKSTRSALGSPFQYFWFSQTMSFIGDRLTGFTVPSIAIIVLHASSTEVGLLSAAGWLAYPMVGLLAGGLLAHGPVRTVLVASELTRLTVFVGCGAGLLAGWTSVPGLAVAVWAAGVATVFGDVAGQTFLSDLLRPGAHFAANSRLQSANSLSKLLGPAIAGLIMDFVGPSSALVITGLPFLLSAAGQSRVRTPEPPNTAATIGHGQLLNRIRGGFSQIQRDALLRWTVYGSTVRAFGIGVVDTAFLLFAYRALNLSELGGGLLFAAGTAGAFAGAMLSSRVVARMGLRAASLLSSLEGATWLALPLCLIAPPLPVVLAIRILSSYWLPVWAVLTTSMRQYLTGARHESTVHATARTLVASATPAGSLVGGAAAGSCISVLGTVHGLVLVLVAGGACAATSGMMLARATRGRTDVERGLRATGQNAGTA